VARPTARYAITAEDKTKAGINSVKKSLGGLRAPFAAFTAISGAVFGAFTKSAFGAADELNKLKTQLGFSTEALSQYKFVAQQTGVEFNALTTGLQRMVRRVGEAAQGTGEAKKALFELGVDAKKLKDLKPEEQFEVLADAFANVENQGDKVRLAFKLFDTEGVRLLRTMEGGSEAVRALREEFARMGGTLEQDVADQASDTVNAMGRLRATFSATSVELIRIFGPAITAVANYLTNTIPKAVRETERALVGARIGFVNLAASLADLFGGDEAADNLRDLASVYTEEFDQISNEVEEFGATLGDAVDANDFFDDSLKKLGGSTAKQTGAQKALNKELGEAKKVFEDTRTPFEAYTGELERLEGLLERARISQETFNRAAADAREGLLGDLDLDLDASPLEAYQERLAGLRTALGQNVIVQGEFNQLLAATREELLEGLGIDPAPVDAYTAALGDLDEALGSTAITFDEYARKRFELEEALESGIDPEGIKKKTTELDKILDDFATGTANSIRDTFSDLFFDAFNSDLDGLVQSFTNTLRRLAADAAASAVLNAIVGSQFGASFAGFFGRALGGPVGVNTPSIVGERGPELLTNAPPGSQVTPGGAMALTVNVAPDAGVSRETAGQVGYTLGRTLQDYMRRNG